MRHGLAEGKLVPAAVLVPFVLGPASGVLLTKRTAHLGAHAGQVASPAGGSTPPTPDAAALREAQEENGLDPARVELIGRLADYVVGPAIAYPGARPAAGGGGAGRARAGALAEEVGR